MMQRLARLQEKKTFLGFEIDAEAGRLLRFARKDHGQRFGEDREVVSRFGIFGADATSYGAWK